MMEFFEWASVGNRWLPVLIGLGMVIYGILELAKILKGKTPKKEEE